MPHPCPVPARIRSPHTFLALALATGSALRAAAAEPTLPPSCAPQLESAAQALAHGETEPAAGAFEAAAVDQALPAFARSLALLGLAEAHLARDDRHAAAATWQRLAADPALPQLHRDLAARRLDPAAAGPADAQTIPAATMPSVQLPELPEPAAAFHLAPGGDDAAAGTQAAPFRTLARAQAAIRELKRAGNGQLAPGGAHVILAGGAYPVTQTLALEAEDSGTAGAPIVCRAAPGQTPVLTGGLRVAGWRPVTDPNVRDRLAPDARDRIIEADLSGCVGADWGDPTELRRRPELFADGEPQTLARWPDEGFVRTGEILGTDTFKVWDTIPGCRDGKFRFLEDRPALWLDEPDVRLYGYWFWDWFEEYQKVASIDAASRVFTLDPPFSNYGYRQDQRYHALNLLCELDRPGEWYLDRRNARIYWLPPEGKAVHATVTVLSMFDQPFIEVRDARHVILLGLTLEEGRGDAIHISGGADCLVAGCTLQRFGGDAVVIDGGERHGVFGSTMRVLGCGGVRMAGGDRQTLTPGRHFVENCTVRDIARLRRTYAPAVHLDGCGNRIAHNLFERMSSSAMRIEGNDHLIELNLVRHVVRESDDQGGIDMFGNPLYRGVVIRWNRWSDIRGGTHCGAAGIRLDDMISGIALYGNVFERCGAALFGGVQIHGGKENLVDNNLFVDCHAAVSFSRWGEGRWQDSIRRFLEAAAAPLYLERYPGLARLEQGADINCISRNIFVRCASVFLRDGGVEQTALNRVVEENIDLAALADAAAVRADPRLRSVIFDAIPVPEMGPYAHPWRANEIGAER